MMAHSEQVSREVFCLQPWVWAIFSMDFISATVFGKPWQTAVLSPGAEKG